MKLSVIVPLFNEEENVNSLVDNIFEALSSYTQWELITVNDGSTDNTLSALQKKASELQNIKIISFPRNQGQGSAMKAGSAAAKGDVIVTLDADLSYSPKDIPKLINAINEDDLVDIVIGSPYTKGGKVEDVSFFRKLLSICANKLISAALSGKLRTVTGMFRAYRKPILNSLELESEGKEIHFEILSKALAINAKVVEVPATLRGRKLGKSKVKIRASIISHILFSFFEKPAIFFEIIGIIMLSLGLASGIYVIVLWQQSALQPTRPLMTLMVLLIVVGLIVLSFAFIASQIAKLRKEIYLVQKENLEIRNLFSKNKYLVQKEDLDIKAKISEKLKNTN